MRWGVESLILLRSCLIQQMKKKNPPDNLLNPSDFYNIHKLNILLANVFNLAKKKGMKDM